MSETLILDINFLNIVSLNLEITTNEGSSDWLTQERQRYLLIVIQIIHF